MLNDIAAVNNAGDALAHQGFGSAQNCFVVSFAAATDEDGDASNLDYFVVIERIVGGVRFDHVSSKLDRLPDERKDLVKVAINHVATSVGVCLEYQRLDHKRHSEVLALRLKPQEVLNALVAQPGLIGELK